MKERNERHVKQLEKQRKLDRIAKLEQEKKLQALIDRSEAGLIVDWDFSRDDRTTAYDKLTVSAEKFDKNHPAAPSLKSFELGFMKPGVFREALKHCFNVVLTPKELGAVIKDFLGAFALLLLVSLLTESVSGHGCEEELDPKLFLIEFMKLGVGARARAKALALEQQRKAEVEAAQERARKQRILTQKTVVDVDDSFTAVDRTNAIAKLTAASAKYDKNAPGCVSLDLFVGSYLTPMQFREAIKNTFSVVLYPKELSAFAFSLWLLSVLRNNDCRCNDKGIRCRSVWKCELQCLRPHVSALGNRRA